MKITCTQSDLSKGLTTAGHALSSRSTLPILSCMHMSAEAGYLQLSATNLEVGISCDVPATIEETGTAALPARLLTEFVQSLPAGDVTITIPEDEHTALVVGQRSQAHIRGMDPIEFPSLSSGAKIETLCSFETAQLKEAISQVAFAAADDDSRPVLTAVLLRAEEDHVTLAAADAFRLAVRNIPMAGAAALGKSPGDLLIPAKTLTELARILPPDGAVELSVAGSHSQARFQTEHLRLVTRLIEGDYPNFYQIIPKTHETRAVIETAEFRAVVKTASPFARDSSNITRLHLVPGNGQEAGSLTIEASSEELGDTVSTLAASVEGAALTLIFNATYLQQVLAVIPTPEVVLAGIDSTKPGVFHPAGASDATYVIMPMHVNR